MQINTLFRDEHRFEVGQVEVKLMPGIPQLHVVGLPDAYIKECGVKLKSALRSCGLDWPQGHQIIVNLRPSYVRKSSSGIDLAIALAFLAQTHQLPGQLIEHVRDGIVYGEVALNGEVFAPWDVGQALRAIGGRRLITGLAGDSVREGEWWEISTLKAEQLQRRARMFNWDELWRPPELPAYEVHVDAAKHLALAVHMGLHVLVAGPQGSGKTTFARVLHALSPPPDRNRMLELAEMFGDEVLKTGWRPLEQPHHTTTAQGLVGGGSPLQPGIISRAHGGVLVLDEFLEFPPSVIEALREPLESGVIELARKGTRERLPAAFQMVATTNLCVCGKLAPGRRGGCGRSLSSCQRVWRRLSGPILDRFDLVVLSHEWLRGERVPLTAVRERIQRMHEFREMRGLNEQLLPDWVRELGLSHRRQRSMLRLARGLADYESSLDVTPQHWQDAFEWVQDAHEDIRQLFA